MLTTLPSISLDMMIKDAETTNYFPSFQTETASDLIGTPEAVSVQL